MSELIKACEKIIEESKRQDWGQWNIPIDNADGELSLEARMQKRWVDVVEAEPIEQIIKHASQIAKACLRMQNKINTLYAAIEHGDVDHRIWLHKAIKDHFSEADSLINKGQSEK